MNVHIPYDPLPTFRPFHATQALEAALIGGYGSGKSRALVADALKLGLATPGAEILIARKTIPSLRDTTEADFFDQIPKELMDASKLQRGGGHAQSFTLPNGSKYLFKGLDDWRKLKSLNLTGIYIDEADEIDEETFDGLKSRLRQVTPLGGSGPAIRHRVMRIGCNPAGHNWIWQRYVNKPRRGSDHYISTSLDNPYLPLSYIEDLLAMPEPWVRRYVFCSFEDFQGSIYPEWDWNEHVVKPMGAYSPRGFFWMGMDPGTAHPTAAVWCYWCPDRQKLIAVAEYAQKGISADHHVQAWRGIEARGTHNETRRPGRMHPMRRRIADPTINTRDRGSMMALESQYLRLGFHFEHGPRQVGERLPMLGQLIRTNRFAVTEECVDLFDQIKQYRYEDLTPQQREKGTEAKPLKRDVDLVDAAQYIASRWIPSATKPKAVPTRDRPGRIFDNDASAELAARGIPMVEEWREQNADLVKAVRNQARGDHHRPNLAESSRGM